MQVRNEYRCRRCSRVFYLSGFEEDSPLEAVMAEIEEELAPQVAHECGYGGVGIGDWIGASEVQDKSQINKTSLER